MAMLFHYRNIGHFLGMYIKEQAEQQNKRYIWLLKKVTMVTPPPHAHARAHTHIAGCQLF